ncbi:TIGR01244 family sulfur transferase [Alkalilacustris brevis]|uniref:TIGR01244 family sulfur transferase n=1 Tax=Alkalilacustris brevis TaxID=2026338 RepID=UPI000E0D822E|nr:TIGR01244 family sulfur transferase [Alkalilacustris brevis]
MDIRPLSDNYAVSPQITVDDVPAIREAGFKVVICNRPDGENSPEQSAKALRTAVEAAGMRFVENGFTGQTLGMEHVETQAKALDEAEGPVLAYCASGNRSSIVWAMALAGTRPTDELIAAGAKYGYQAAAFRAQIEALAKARG